MQQMREENNILIIVVFSTFGLATQILICYKRSAFLVLPTYATQTCGGVNTCTTARGTLNFLTFV